MNQFREWLSDNLRYILLILGVLAILLGLFFGVRAISRKVAGTDTESQLPAETESAETASALTPAVTTPPAPASDHGTLTETADAEITDLMTKYYDAIGRQDLSALREMTDTLPEEEAAKISSATTTYSDIKFYTKNGPDANSKIVYAYYHYLNANQPTPLPGLAQMFIKKDASGAYKIIYGELDEATKNYIDAVYEDQDVQDLVTKVRAEYMSVMSAAEASASADSKPDADSADSKEDTGTENDASSEEGESASENGEESGGKTEDSDRKEIVIEDYGDTGNPDEPIGIFEIPEDEESGSEEEAGQEEEDSYEDTSERTAVINSSCNVRSGPGYDYKVIGGVVGGESVTVIGSIEGGWWHIRSGDLEGYVGRKFID